MKTVYKALIAIVLLGAIGFGGFKILVPRMDLADAGKQMDPDEQEYFAKFSQVQTGTTLGEVTKIFGRPPDRGGETRPTWKVGSHSQVAMYFKDGRLLKKRWIKVPGFIVEEP